MPRALLCKRFGFKTVALTMRQAFSAESTDWAAMLYHGGEPHFSRRHQTPIVDRLGAGDSFTGTLIFALRRGDAPARALELAVAASCLKHTVAGDYNLDQPRRSRGASGRRKWRAGAAVAGARRERYCQTTQSVLPSRTMTTISLKVPEALLRAVKQEAAALGVAQSVFIRESIERTLKKKSSRRKKPSCLDLAGDLVGLHARPAGRLVDPRYLEEAIMADHLRARKSRR